MSSTDVGSDATVPTREVERADLVARGGWLLQEITTRLPGR